MQRIIHKLDRLTMRDFAFIFLFTLLMLTLSGCATKVDQLGRIGQEPEMNAITNPQTRPNYEPVTWPMPSPQPSDARYANSLWQPGSKTFFRDLRASQVGDIVRVKVEIADKAELDNTTNIERDGSETLQVPQVFGLGDKLFNILPGNQDPSNLANITAANSKEGTGDIAREETIETVVAAIVTQKLPNGNLVIEGDQEVRVNYELREIKITGVIRPEDINENNTIEHSKIAQARIAYGGRGQISDQQQPRWGYQVIDALSPF